LSRPKIQLKNAVALRNASLRRGEHARPDAEHHDSATLGLDPLIHERMRLGIISALAVRDTLTFSELKKLLDASDGNLSVHARKLEEANYILCSKGFDGRVPRTEYRISATGRRALENYLDHMEGIIHSTRRK
jgi:DNA-binding MarR family transcriptional regulator